MKNCSSFYSYRYRNRHWKKAEFKGGLEIEAIEQIRAAINQLELLEQAYLTVVYEGWGRGSDSQAGNEIAGAVTLPTKDSKYALDSQIQIKNEAAHKELDALRRQLDSNANTLRTIARKYSIRLLQLAPKEPRGNESLDSVHQCPACGKLLIGGRKDRHCSRQENEGCFRKRQAEWKRKERKNDD